MGARPGQHPQQSLRQAVQQLPAGPACGHFPARTAGVAAGGVSTFTCTGRQQQQPLARLAQRQRFHAGPRGGRPVKAIRSGELQPLRRSAKHMHVAGRVRQQRAAPRPGQQGSEGRQRFIVGGGSRHGIDHQNAQRRLPASQRHGLQPAHEGNRAIIDEHPQPHQTGRQEETCRHMAHQGMAQRLAPPEIGFRRGRQHAEAAIVRRRRIAPEQVASRAVEHECHAMVAGIAGHLRLGGQRAKRLEALFFGVRHHEVLPPSASCHQADDMPCGRCRRKPSGCRDSESYLSGQDHAARRRHGPPPCPVAAAHPPEPDSNMAVRQRSTLLAGLASAADRMQR